MFQRSDNYTTLPKYSTRSNVLRKHIDIIRYIEAIHLLFTFSTFKIHSPIQ